jgi:ABC-type amino acid transport substrate-binding protein
VQTRERALVSAAVAACLLLSSAALAAELAGKLPAAGRPPESLHLHTFYTKYVDAGGIPVVGSSRASDYALREAAYIVNQMLAGRPDIRSALLRGKLRVAVMAYNEFTTDIPEHSHLEPREYWNKRARGLGATPEVPVVSCAEENLLHYPGDPYAVELILVHEFGHTIQELALNVLDPDFPRRLQECYDRAMKKGLWKGTYAATCASEYWAEGIQDWFDANGPPDREHNQVNTREELRAYDPDLAELIAQALGDTPWRYQPPDRRPQPGHLLGYDPAKAPRFVWPLELLEWNRQHDHPSPQPPQKEQEATAQPGPAR